MSAPEISDRQRALDAEEAIRQLVDWIVQELDPHPAEPTDYVTGRAVAAVGRAERGRPRKLKFRAVQR